MHVVLSDHYVHAEISKRMAEANAELQRVAPVGADNAREEFIENYLEQAGRIRDFAASVPDGTRILLEPLEYALLEENFYE